MLPRAPSPLAAALALAALPRAALACTVWVDWNTYNSSAIALALSSPAFLAAQGSWWIEDNSANVTAAQWRAALAAVGAQSSLSEDNAWGWPNASSFYAADCGALPAFAPSAALRATFMYHEFTADTMLNNSEIATASAACGGAPVVGLTRAFWPGSGWKTRVEQALANPLLLGVAMEMNPDDWGPRNEDDFVKELLASDRLPLFLLPFRTPNPKNLSSEDQMRGLTGFLASRGANLSDDRLVFVIANYDFPPLDVLGETNSVESALRATMAACGRPAPAAASVLFSMPDTLDLQNATLVRVNPPSGVLPYNASNTKDVAVLTLWRVGDGPLANVSDWDVADWTGARRGSPQVGMTPDVPGSSAVAFANGTLGVLLSTIANPVQNGSALGTIVVEFNWGAETQVRSWDVGGSGSESIISYKPKNAERD